MEFNGFATLMAAVLGANLLSAMFIYGAVLWAKAERDGKEPKLAWSLVMLVPLGIFALAFFGIVPRP